MAEHLASIFGTEKDRVNCPFYFKIGACRHGDRCSRLHNKPTISQTILLQNMYQNPVLNAPMGPDGLPQPVDPKFIQRHYEEFYEDVFEELDRYGEVENLNVCDNLADHMVGNVYVKFRDEEAAARAVQGLAGRYYNGRPITVEFSPVTDFREATCRQYEEQTCNRGGYCNFMHLKPIDRGLRKHLFGRYGRRERERSRSPARGGGGRGGGDRRGRSPQRGAGGGGGRRDRESSAERRAKIASWNTGPPAAAGPPVGGPPMYPPPNMGGGYPGPPPGAGYQSYPSYPPPQ